MSMSSDRAERSAGARAGWKQDPEAVRSDILKVALTEFATHGLSGARIDEIAAKTKTSKRMIYYYFGDKNGLYQQVLEEAYRSIRAGEEALELDHLAPVAALRRLVEFTFDHHWQHPDVIRLVAIENIHHGRYLAGSTIIRDVNIAAIDKLETIYRRGLADGLFRDGITPLELHWHISALSFFNVSNRYTFSLIFGDGLLTPSGQHELRGHVVDMVLRFVLRPDLIARHCGTGDPVSGAQV